MDKNHIMTISAQQAPGVIFDVDDVLCDTCVKLHEGLLIELNQDIPIEQWHHHHLSKVYSSIADDFINEIITKHNVFSECQPIKGAKQALQCFRDKGYTLHLCTARGMVEDHEVLTQQWLHDHDIPYDTVTYVPFGSRKSEAYKHLDSVFSYMFDDAIHNIDDAIDSQLVIKPTVVTKPWNSRETNYMRTSSIYDFCRDAGWL